MADDPKTTPESPEKDSPAADPAFKPMTLKVNGKDVVVDSQEKLIELAQKGAASNEVFQEAAKARKVQELAQKAVLQGDRAAERDFYKALGMADEEINKMFQQTQGQVQEGRTATGQPADPAPPVEYDPEEVRSVAHETYQMEEARKLIRGMEEDLEIELDDDKEVAKIIERVKPEARDRVKGFLTKQAREILRTDLDKRIQAGQDLSKRATREIVRNAALQAKVTLEAMSAPASPTLGRAPSGSLGSGETYGYPTEKPKPPTGPVNEENLSKYVTDALLHNLDLSKP